MLLREVTTLLLIVTLSACGGATRDRAWLEASTLARTHQRLGPPSIDDGHPLPPGCAMGDGLSPDEAVSIALWRSPVLQAELANLDASLADVDEAGRLPNPRLSFLAPLDPRQLALILTWPIDAIWQTPLRTAAANRELERVAESLVQTVLDTERDLRLAHADTRLAYARIEVLRDVSSVWKQALGVAESRANAGDISPADAAPVRAEAELADDAVARAAHEAEIRAARLLQLLASPWPRLPVLSAPSSRAASVPAIEKLMERAYQRRPDLRAAELAIHAAAARGRWERARVFSLVAALDGKAPVGKLAPDFTGGAQAEIPVFSQNQGGVGRADAAVTRAGYLYAAARLNVAFEVTAAREATLRATESLAAQERVVAALTDAAGGADRAFLDGAESYLVVIDALRRQAAARLRSIELDAELARAEADLSRAVGGATAMEEL